MEALADHAVDVIIGTVLTGLLGTLVWAGKRWLRDEITRATYPIQSHANGGLSLPDVAKAAAETRGDVRAIAERQLQIHGDVQRLVGAFETHLKNHE